MKLSIALVGNPNVGKTSLYNRLTRSFEHVGNWHGVTVEKVSKTLALQSKTITVDDLPGMYSLTSCSYEESIARDSVLYGRYDVIVNVCEVNNLVRNLYLTLQLLELGLPVVLVVNMIDELHKRGRDIDTQRLQSVLSIPVMTLSATHRIDTQGFFDALESMAKAYRKSPRPKLSYLERLPISQIMMTASQNILHSKLPATFAAVKLLENDDFVIQKLELSKAQQQRIEANRDTQSKVAGLRYEFIERAMCGVIIDSKHNKKHPNFGFCRHQSKNESKNKPFFDKKDGFADRLTEDINHNASSRRSILPITSKSTKKVGCKTDSIDRLLLNKYLALPIFFAIMLLIFVVTFGLLGRLMSKGLEQLIEKCLLLPTREGLTKAGAWSWLNDLICEGIIKGVGSILVFLPQVVLLFFFLALLEDSGYIARVAFMTDGIFRKIGLSGRSAFTMLMGFGCSATAVLTARGLEDTRMRQKTVLLTPFMSCSARLPVYSAIISAFFVQYQGIIVFLLYLLGVVVAFLTAAIMQKLPFLASGRLSFIMEMPPYRLPTLERVCQLILSNAKVFVARVGTVIFSLSVIVWLLANFSIMGYTREVAYPSFLETLAGLIAPIFLPLGFGNWQAVSALISGLMAKEAVLSSVESLGGISAIFCGANAELSALCFLVFTLLYVPCIATTSAIAKEVGYRWAVASLILSTLVAYSVALLVRLLGVLVLYGGAVAISLLVLAIIGLLLWQSLLCLNRKKCCRSCEHCQGNCK